MGRCRYRLFIYGTYTLFITDSLGCVYIEDFIVEENPDVELNEIVYPPSCNGDANASVID